MCLPKVTFSPKASKRRCEVVLSLGLVILKLREGEMMRISSLGRSLPGMMDMVMLDFLALDVL
jgi:hypothetical protein